MKKIKHIIIIATLAMAGCQGGMNISPEKDVVFQNMDTTIKPWDNFFMYANGNWIKKNPIPEAYASWGIGNLVSEEVRNRIKLINEEAVNTNNSKGSTMQLIGDFYFTGMDSAGIEAQGLLPLKELIAQIDGIQHPAELQEKIAILKAKGSGGSYSMGIYQDAKNSERIALYLNQGGLGMPNRDYYFNTDARTSKIRKEYREVFLPKMCSLLGDVNASESAEKIFQLELAMASKCRKLEDLRDPYANYNKKSLLELNTLMKGSDWKKQLLLMGIDGVDSIIVGQPEFFIELSKLFNSKPLADWKNYLKVRLLLDYSDELTSAVGQETFHFYGTLISGRKAQLPRWKRVLANEENLLGEVLGKIYVEKYCSPETKKRYEQMTKNVMDAYAERISKLDWMTDITKERALKKLKSIRTKVLYPDEWKDYSGLSFDRTSYFKNVMNAQEFLFKREVEKLKKPVDRNEWGMTPQTYNAYYNPSNNEIVLPAAIFVIPGVKDEEMDDAVVYGYGAASTIGHELTHGFDDEGRQFDEMGNLNNWWTKDDEERFKKKADLLVKQFSEYVVLDSMHVNGKATLGENIADLGGVVLGLEAFKKTEQYKKGEKINGLTPVQRYFLGYALGWLGHIREEALANQILTDVHSPVMFRVNGPFVNIPEFYEAFGIKEGSTMWRADSLRVSIW